MKVELDKGRELLYKSFELSPLPKMSVEIGKEATKKILNRLEYIGSLTIPRNLSWLGVNKNVVPMDAETARLIRDHSVFSTVRRIADHGTAHQYGHVLLEGKDASMPLVGAASAIAVVEENEAGEIKITRKKQLNLENKHAKELINEFHNFDAKIKSNIEDVERLGESNAKMISGDDDTSELQLKDEEGKPDLKWKKTVEEVEDGKGSRPHWL